MKTLTLSLKRKWFDMIKAGFKKEEYRDGSMSFYWANRLRERSKTSDGLIYGDFKHFDRLVFTLGYPKAGDTERRLGGEHVLALLGITLKVRMVA